MDIKEMEKIINTKLDELAEIIDIPRAAEYRIRKIQKAQSYENKTVKDITKELLTHYREWDKYSAAIMTATIIKNNNYQWKGKIKRQIEAHLLI
jgi:tryptophanase